MDIALFALLFGLFIGAIAAAKNRSFFLWFLIGLFLGPIGLLILFFPSIQPEYTDPDTGLALELILTAEATSRYSELDELMKQHELKEIRGLLRKRTIQRKIVVA